MTDYPRLPLGSLVKIVRGISYKSSELADGELGVPMVNLRNVGKGGGFRTDGLKRYTGEYKSSQVLQPGDLVLANTDLSKAKDVLGSTFLIPHTLSGAVLSLDLSKLVPDESVINKRFLNYFLHSPEARAFMKEHGQGITVMHLRMSALPSLEVPVPPLEEQKRLVEALDDHLSRLDKALADLRFASIKSSHLFLAALDQAIEEVGQGSYKSLRECLISLEGKKLVQRGWSPQCLAHPKSNVDNWAVLKTTAVQNMRFEPQHNKELPRTLTPKQHLEVLPGDFLMTTTGPRNRCGVVCHVASTPEKLIFSGKILRFRPDPDQVKPAWLELVLASHKYQKQLDSLKVGSSDSSVSIGNAQVLELLIPVPTLAAQDRLISRVERMKELSERFELEISHETKKFQHLRDALLNKTFAGNLESE